MARKKKFKLPPWTHGAAYFAIRTAMSALTIGDLGLTIRIARSGGRAFAGAPFNRKRVLRAMDNLAVAFPDWPEDKRREYAIKAFEHLFMLCVETASTQRLLTEDGWSRHVQVGSMGEALHDLLRAAAHRSQTGGRGCVLISGHTGNWELLGYTMALLGFPMHALFRPLDNKPLNRWLHRTRESRGLVLLDKFGATQTLPLLIESGRPVGFVADQNGGDRGLFVPFFDRLASSYKSIGLLALKYDAPIICGQARRLVWGRDVLAAAHDDPEVVGFNDWKGEPFRYRIDVYDVISPEDWADQPDPLFYVTARYRRAIEAMVRRAPEQYLWMHRCWKSRPRHEKQGKPIPGHMREKIESLPWMTQEQLDRILEWSERDSRTFAEPAAQLS